MRRARGFTLAEVAVAVVVLGLWTLGASATLALAARTLRDAAVRERRAAAAAWLLDSLAGVRGGAGEVELAHGVAAWSVAADGEVRLVVRSHQGDSLAVRGWTALPGPQRGAGGGGER